MAEEGINVPISPEIVISDRVLSSFEREPIASKSRGTKQLDPLRASTGSFNNEGRKISSGKQSPLNCGSKLVPHYLRASTGPYHDFCKYGIKHEFEEKPWQTKSRKAKNSTLNQQNDPQIRDLSEKNVSKNSSPIPSFAFRNKISSQSNELAIPSGSVSAKVDKAVNEKKNVIEKQNTPVLRGKRESDSGFIVKSRLVSTNNITEKINTQVSTIRGKIEIKPDKTKGSSKEVTKPSSNGVLSSKGNTNRSKNYVSNLKDQNKVKTGHKHATNNTLEVKIELGIEVEDKQIAAEGREKKREGIKEVESVFIENEKIAIDIPLSEEEAKLEPEYTNIEKKVAEFEQNESTFDSLSSPNSSSQVKSPALSCGEEEALDELEYLDTETDGSDDSISESSEILNPEKNNVATKSKFKRGKVVEIKSNNSGPRRLRFRRGKVLNENQDKNVKNQRRSFAKVGIDDDIDDKNGDSEKVVLRHQEVEGKKDAQGLFNNVIEATANKLVEIRKSKVKALVGAFETVISLQEGKPATQSDFSER